MSRSYRLLKFEFLDNTQWIDLDNGEVIPGLVDRVLSLTGVGSPRPPIGAMVDLRMRHGKVWAMTLQGQITDIDRHKTRKKKIPVFEMRIRMRGPVTCKYDK